VGAGEADAKREGRFAGSVANEKGIGAKKSDFAARLSIVDRGKAAPIVRLLFLRERLAREVIDDARSD
jgi:hypothetical protein